MYNDEVKPKSECLLFFLLKDIVYIFVVDLIKVKIYIIIFIQSRIQVTNATFSFVNISKVSIKSIFTVKKYNTEILEEDLYRIQFIRNLIEESFEFVKEYHKEIDTELYHSELKDYALELFLKQCEEAIPEEEKNEQGFNLENHKEEDKEYFNFIYSNLKYPE